MYVISVYWWLMSLCGWCVCAVQAKQAEDLKAEAASGDNSSTNHAAAAASASIAKMEVKPQVAQSEVSEGFGLCSVNQVGGQALGCIK